jgi:putative ATP-binding cassette transporter
VVENWWQLIAAQRRLTVFTALVGQANSAAPLLVAAPGFFAGLITLGAVVQIRIAYGQVSAALSWFVYAYQEIARWRANVERLATFSEVLDATDRDLAQSRIQVVRNAAPALQLTDVRLQTSKGEALLEGVNATVARGERVAILGPSGAGKTVLLRAIAGIWPFGAGHIAVPSSTSLLFVPQWPYLPLGSLRAAVSYPSPEGTFADQQLAEVLRQLGLERLIGRLDETVLWDQELSPHEQQRLSIARVLLNRPEWVFLDKVTSALDEAMEQRAYGLLLARLPRATMISVANRPAVAAYHTRRWTIAPADHGPTSLREI